MNTEIWGLVLLSEMCDTHCCLPGVFGTRQAVYILLSLDGYAYEWVKITMMQQH